MKFDQSHILLFGRVMLIAVFLANTGFTAVLYSCKMDPATCCQTSRQSKHGECGASAIVHQRVSVESNFSCHRSTVIGGITTAAALIEKEYQPLFNKAVQSVSPQFMGNSPLSVAAPTSYSLSPPLARAIPSVEKYVLNATLLI